MLTAAMVDPGTYHAQHAGGYGQFPDFLKETVSRQPGTKDIFTGTRSSSPSPTAMPWFRVSDPDTSEL
ncbi:MAG TPA: hypothetical protein VK489_02595 [Ferruginibacter sp.]|nr:hypothetical protein [Ferruginibacter sp.]